MVESIRVLLQGQIDYAGLFPPAALPLEDAVREFGQIQASAYHWLVGSFVCPVGWLHDFAKLLPNDPPQPWSITVLGTSIEGFRQDMNLIERFAEAAGQSAEVTGYEVKGTHVELTLPAIRRLEDTGLDVYVEIPWRTELAESLAPLVDTALGAKARTGGLEAEMFPSNEECAALIHECASLDVPFKLTAGLHHPFPTVDALTGARMQGFVNLQVANVLAESHDLSRAELTTILATDDPSAFHFSDDGVHFESWDVPTTDLFGFHWGSCSAQEPVDDLTEIKLFP